MAYTRVNWANGSGGGTPIDATHLNVMDAYIATLDTNAVLKDGSVTITAPGTGQKIQTTLSGSTKELMRFIATDGKTYAIRLTVAGELEVFNITDSVSVLKLGPTAGGIAAGGNTVWHAGNDGSGSGLDADLLRGRKYFVQASDPGGAAATGDVWIKDA